MAVTKSDIVDVVLDDFKQAGYDRYDAQQFVEDFFEAIVSTLEDGDNVKIQRFGRFEIREKNARVGRNPKNGNLYPIVARTVVVFKPSVYLKKLINDDEFAKKNSSRKKRS
jgi:integration host factor subunit alpha